MEEIDKDVTNNDAPKKKFTNKHVFIILACCFIGSICVVGICCNDTELDYTDTDIGKYTELYLKQNVLYPNTFKMKEMECYRWNTEDEEGYEMWKTVGYFESESKVGLKVKSDYIVYLKYNKKTRDCKKLTVYIDGKIY